MRSKIRKRVGRSRICHEVRDLIFRMVAENPTWGAPRIHGELLLLGFDVSERSISRWMRRAPRDLEPARRWLAFLRNHREAIAAMDFFTVPTVTFQLLYCFFNHSPRPATDCSTSRVIPPVSGSCNNCEKRFPTSRLHGSSSWIVTRSMAGKFRKPYNPCESLRPKLPSTVLGRTGWLSAGWAVAGASCSIT